MKLEIGKCYKCIGKGSCISNPLTDYCIFKVKSIEKDMTYFSKTKVIRDNEIAHNGNGQCSEYSLKNGEITEISELDYDSLLLAEAV